MPLNHKALVTCLLLIFLMGASCMRRRLAQGHQHPRLLRSLPRRLPRSPEASATPRCDASLWHHVYTGDPTRFSTPQDRLKVITPCIAVTGTIFNFVLEPDGDYHIRVTVDPQFKSLLNA